MYVLFCCQQAVEKALKSLIVKNTNDLPPRIHRLARLAEITQANLNEDQTDFLRELTAYYIPTRYPEDTADLAIVAKKDKAQRVFDQSKELIQWLMSTLE